MCGCVVVCDMWFMLVYVGCMVYYYNYIHIVGVLEVW